MVSARKFVSIFLLFLMGMNTIGYYSFLVIIKHQLTQRVIGKIQSGINAPGGEMIIKIPMAIPYQANSSGYEAISGEISYEQSVYRLVKQRVYNDTLYVECVRDNNTTEANKNIKEYSKSFSGENKEQGTGIKLVSAAAKYYAVAGHAITPSQSAWSRTTLFFEVPVVYGFDTGRNIFHPPKCVA